MCDGDRQKGRWIVRKRVCVEREGGKKKKKEREQSEWKERIFLFNKIQKKETTGSICISRICGFFHFYCMKISTLKLILKR